MIVTPEGSPFPDSDTGAAGNNTPGQGGGKASGTGTNAGTGNGGGADKGAGTEKVIDRVVHGVHHAVDRLAEQAQPTAERLKSGVSGAADKMQSQADHLGAMQEEWVAACRACVRAHPLRSVGVAVLAGMVLSRIMR